MDFRITLDITERFADALNALVRIVQNISIQAARTAISEPLTYSAGASDTQPVQTAPEPVAEAEPVVIPPATESAPADTVQPQETVIAETPTNDDAAEPTEKPKKKRAQKKPVEAPEPASEPEAPAIPSVPEPAPAAPTEAATQPQQPEGDPMAGMTVVEAMQALVSEIQQKGVDMAAVNGRVRAKANELGLAYSSAACLIKAIGYIETRKVALGEK